MRECGGLPQTPIGSLLPRLRWRARRPWGRKRELDSTPLYEAVATMDTVTLIRSAIRGLLMGPRLVVHSL